MKYNNNKKLVPLSKSLFATFLAGLVMAFRVIKQRREARRNAKLEEIFLERDKLQNETISSQDMMDVFRMYGVSNTMGSLSDVRHVMGTDVNSRIIMGNVAARVVQATSEQD